MDIAKKAEYLKGLADGLELGDSKQEKLLKAIVELLTEMAEDVEDYADKTAEIEEYCEELDEDLGSVEEYLYQTLNEENSCDCGCDCDDDCDCDCCDDEEDDEYSAICPICNEEFFLDDEDFEAEFIECPYCGEKVTLAGCDCGCEDYAEELPADDDCDCGCCHE